MSLRDIARNLGVSHATVSLALRGHPRISEATREKVEQEARRIGYRPDPMLAALASYRRDRADTPIAASIGWINAWEQPSKLRSYEEFDCYWKGALKAAQKFGYRLEEFKIGPDCRPQRLHGILSARGIRGLLLPPQNPHPDWTGFPWEDYSVVRFGRSLQEPRTHLVTADQAANTQLAIASIRERGYRRIGFVTDDANLRRGHLFLAGYLFARHTLPAAEQVPLCSISEPHSSHGTAIAEWIRREKVDAILTDLGGLPTVLSKAGVRVPEDVGLAVTSILDGAADSGIDQHPEEIGRVGFLMLNSLINDRSTGVPRIFRQILVEGSWVDGASLPDRR